MSRVWHPQFVAVVTIVDMNGHHGEYYDCCCVETAVHYHHYQEVDCSQYYEAQHLEVSILANEMFACWTKPRILLFPFS